MIEVGKEDKRKSLCLLGGCLLLWCGLLRSGCLGCGLGNASGLGLAEYSWLVDNCRSLEYVRRVENEGAERNLHP